MTERGHHTPVLLREAVEGLAINPDGVYIDATFGGGGHSHAILERLGADGRLLAFDRDPEAIARARALQLELDHPERFSIVHASFAAIEAEAGVSGHSPVDGVLFDLGLSSFQLNTPSRGFSFLGDGPLDMRFDPTLGESAFDLVNSVDEVALADLIWRFGEERRSRAIAAAIVRTRVGSPIETTTELATIVEEAVGGRHGARTHPATQTFQALRMAVNTELEALDQGLRGAIELLAPGARLVVISFHSLEDRLAKQLFQFESIRCICPPEQPICTCAHQPRLRIVNRKVKPTSAETASNPRSRSAIMRVAERLPKSKNEVAHVSI